MHRLLSDLRAFDASNHWAEAGARSCANWLSWRVGWDPGTAREHLRVARALGELPLIDAALSEGRLSYSKVRAITRVATPAIEAALLDDARRTTAAQLEVICRALRSVQRQGALSADDVRARRMVTRRERGDGMVTIEAVLPADEAAIVFAAIEHEATPTFFHRGRQLHAEPPRVVATPLGWPSIHAANADLDLDATTGQCTWDGQAIAYELVVDSLVHLARAG